jgi:hypothetical protein
MLRNWSEVFNVVNSCIEKRLQPYRRKQFVVTYPCEFGEAVGVSLAPGEKFLFANVSSFNSLEFLDLEEIQPS